jgi:hypothetical protein
MAALKHVCMWLGNGWKRITPEEAAKLHPGGTVSAHSGLFMCELCSQYVILTDGDVRTRYFKHSAYEKSKDCPERTFADGYPISYILQSSGTRVANPHYRCFFIFFLSNIDISTPPHIIYHRAAVYM